jgi:hypothetical protein
MRSHDGQRAVVEGVDLSEELTVVYNLEVSNYHTFFVGSERWGFSVWVHNLNCVKAREIVRKALGDLAEVKGFRQSFIRSGNRAEWASRGYLRDSIYGELQKLYPNVDASRLKQIAESAADEMLVAANRGDPALAGFKPQVLPENTALLPKNPTLSPNLKPGVTGRTQYRLNGQNPFSIDLNSGEWNRSLGAELDKVGSTKGVYILRDTKTGEILKVGKADNLVGRMEQYASDYVSNGHTITAEIYPLAKGGTKDAEPVLRSVVDADGWILPGEGQQSRKQMQDPGFGGFTGERIP